jgi:quinol monooxygenase YgiN
MSTTFIATITVKAGKEAEFERLQKELSELTHAHEPGTTVYDVIKSRSKPRTYVVYGRFKDEAAFDLHMHSPFHDRLVPPILACAEGEMDLQMYDFRS